MNGLRHQNAEGAPGAPPVLRSGAIALVLALAAGLAGCAAVDSNTSRLPPTAIQTPEYYPHLVKGYRNTYPSRRMLVLLTVDKREFRGRAAADHAPDNGNPATGVVLDRNGAVLQRLYSAPFLTIFQKALAQSAEEAGMVALQSNASTYSAERKQGEDYVLESRLIQCWVTKQLVSDSSYSRRWQTTAECALEAILYKPPFHVPYWQGASSAVYSDPPVAHLPSYSSTDDVAIYDEPGQVLSIALTRAVAGIFEHDDLRTLVAQDRMVHPH